MISTTYTPDYEIAIQILLSPKIEGGYSDHPNDSAGPTNMGVTQGALKEYNKRNHKTWSVQTLTKDEAREFYFDEYWVPLQLHELHNQELKNVVFATAVNRGKFAAIHGLQVCAKMPPDSQDGKMGPKTIAYVNAEVDPKWLVNRYCDFHEDGYRRLAQMWYVKDNAFNWRPVLVGTPGAIQKNKTFEKGWLRRINTYRIA